MQEALRRIADRTRRYWYQERRARSRRTAATSAAICSGVMLSSRAARRTLPTMRASFFRLAALAGDSKISTSESRCATTAFPHPFIQEEGITTPSLVYFTAFIGNASSVSAGSIPWCYGSVVSGRRFCEPLDCRCRVRSLSTRL